MSHTSDRENYIARASQARADADAATLDNVRDRCLRAEAAWTAMADRAGRTERLREAQIAHKAQEKLDAEATDPDPLHIAAE